MRHCPARLLHHQSMGQPCERLKPGATIEGLKSTLTGVENSSVVGSFGARHGGYCSELLHQGEEVCDAPVLRDLSVARYQRRIDRMPR